MECRRCKEYRPMSDYPVRSDNGSRRRVCRVCRNKDARGYAKKYVSKNIEKVRESSRNRARELRGDPEKRKIMDENHYRWVIANKDYIRAKSAKRRAQKLKATPFWANKKYMDLFYLLAAEETERTGRQVHVDHIVPLKGENVCGLHCEHNLQLLFAEDNLKKSNKTEW